MEGENQLVFLLLHLVCVRYAMGHMHSHTQHVDAQAHKYTHTHTLKEHKGSALLFTVKYFLDILAASNLSNVMI